MARFGITYDEVVQIAEALLQHGIPPTMQRVREKLGNTGSFATLSKYLNAWRSERLLATTSENLLNPVPPEPVSRAVAQVWEQINSQTQDQITQIKKEWEEKFNAILQEKQTLEQFYQLSQENNTKLQTENSHLTADYQLLNERYREEKEQREELEIQVKHWSHLYETMQLEAKQHIQTIQQIHEKSTQEFHLQRENIQKEADKVISEFKNLMENQRADFIVKLDHYKTANQKLSNELTKSESELQHIIPQFDNIKIEKDSLKVEFKSLQESYGVLKETVQSTQAELSAQKEILNILNKLRDSECEKANLVEEYKNQLKLENASLRKQIQRLEAELQELQKDFQRELSAQ